MSKPPRAAIAPKILPGACVIIESTSPVGTNERVAAIIAEARPDLAILSVLFLKWCRATGNYRGRRHRARLLSRASYCRAGSSTNWCIMTG